MSKGVKKYVKEARWKLELMIRATMTERYGSEKEMEYYTRGAESVNHSGQVTIRRKPEMSKKKLEKHIVDVTELEMDLRIALEVLGLCNTKDEVREITSGIFFPVTVKELKKQKTIEI